MDVGGRKYADAGAHLRINDGEGALPWGRRCARVGAWVWLWASVEGQWWRRRVVDGGRYVRKRVSEFIGTYQNLSEEIGWVRINSDWLQ